MLNIKLDTMLASLVRQLLIDAGGNDKALHFHLDLHLSHHTNSKSYDVRAGLHLLYHLPPGYGAVSVFSALFNSPRARLDAVKDQWTHEITHDSEWRSIHLFADTYFGMAKDLNAKLVSDKLEEIAPIQMHEHNTPVFGGNLFSWVPVQVKKDPTDKFNYRRTIKVL